MKINKEEITARARAFYVKAHKEWESDGWRNQNFLYANVMADFAIKEIEMALGEDNELNEMLKCFCGHKRINHFFGSVRYCYKCSCDKFEEKDG